MLKITENAELKTLKNTIKNAKIEILNNIDKNTEKYKNNRNTKE